MCPIERLRSLPRGADTVGSTDDWLAVRVGEKPGRYLMHNPFVNKSVPLAELEAVIGNHKSDINKFLMRSGADDLVAVITNNRRHAFMVIRPGKGVCGCRRHGHAPTSTSSTLLSIKENSTPSPRQSTSSPLISR
jgi:hypothetical protein